MFLSVIALELSTKSAISHDVTRILVKKKPQNI